MFTKMLVPLDGSDNAEVVIPYVIEIGVNLGMEIVLTSVSKPGIAGLEQLHRAYLERKAEQLQNQIDDYSNLKEASISFSLLSGKASDEIVKHARLIGADVITIASRGSSGQVPPLLGNISTKVLWSADKPVLLIKTTVTDRAIKERRLIKKILLPLDSSRVSEITTGYARELAEALGAELVLFQALEPVTPVIGFETMSPLAIPDEQDIEKEALDYLERVAGKLESGAVSITRETAWGSAAECILDYAETHEIDLIAMSARGKSNISRWAFGSVTEKVLHYGKTALLIIR